MISEGEATMFVVGEDVEEPGFLLAIQVSRDVSVDQLGERVHRYFGVGKPFLAFHDSALPGSLRADLAWNPEALPAPVVSELGGANAAAIQGMLADVALQTSPNASVFSKTAGPPSA